MTRADLQADFEIPNIHAFSHVVRQGESRQDVRAYHMRYGGAGKAPAYFEDLSAHPRIFEPTPGGLKSSAAGAYQATWTTWSEEKKRHGWPDFSTASQDEFFVARLHFRKAIEPLKAGDFWEACRRCRNEWTSLPGGPEENSATPRALKTYLKYGGTINQPKEVA